MRVRHVERTMYTHTQFGLQYALQFPCKSLLKCVAYHYNPFRWNRSDKFDTRTRKVYRLSKAISWVKTCLHILHKILLGEQRKCINNRFRRYRLTIDSFSLSWFQVSRRTIRTARRPQFTFNFFYNYCGDGLLVSK